MAPVVGVPDGTPLGLDEATPVGLPVVTVGVELGLAVGLPVTALGLPVVAEEVGLPVTAVGDPVGLPVVALGVELGPAVGLPVVAIVGLPVETGLAVGSDSIGTTVFGASVFTQDGSHGMVTSKATVLCPSVEVRSEHVSGIKPGVPDDTAPWR